MLNEFLDYVFGGTEEGFFALTLFQGGKPVAEQFIDVPNGLSRLSEKKIQDLGRAGDVYFTPALFHAKKRQMEFCRGSWVAWADIDDVPTDLPREAPSCPPAGLLVASGSPGRVHQYHRSGAFLPKQALLETNRFFGLNVPGADKSGHDPTQLLRVPGTYNHKHNPPRPVEVIELNGTVYDLSDYRSVVDEFETASLALAEVPAERWDELSEYTRDLFNSRPQQGFRSEKLFELACRLLEEHFTIEEARRIVDEADQKFGKFVGRSDRNEQLDTLLLRAKEKTEPVVHIISDESDEQGINWNAPVGLRTLLTKSPKLSWIIEGILHKQGLMYLVGPTGVGKTTLAFNLGLSIALSKKQWLDLEIEQREVKEKILVASHEMNNAELVEFLDPMTMDFTEQDFEHLEEYFQVRAKGQAVALDEEKNQAQYETALRTGQFTGFILDTLGASTKTSLQDEAGARKIADWLDRLRQKYGIWVIVIAHPRKAPAGVKNYKFNIEDAYGSRVFQDRASSTFIMQRSGHNIELSAAKTRFRGNTDTVFLHRGTTHWFEKTTASTAKAPITIAAEMEMPELTDKDLQGKDNDDLG